MSRVLSYLKEGSIEYLADHVNSCLALISELEESRVGRSGSVMHPRFVDSVRIAIVFHDLGKAFYWRSGSSMSFPGHEIISAYMLGKYREELLRSAAPPEEASGVLPSLFAVLLHHHAMGLSKRLDLLSRVKFSPSHLENLMEELGYLRHDAMLREERELLNRVLESMKSKLREGLSGRDLRNYVEENLLKIIYGHLSGGKEENVRMKRLCYLCLVSLVTADYLAASGRGGSGTGFGDVVEEFHRTYMRSHVSKGAFPI